MSEKQMTIIKESTVYDIEVADYIDSESDVDVLIDEFDLDLETNFDF